ncbi:hypothetical protein EDB81DRAFT_799007 [Dactylonectria macrodidyma]|uniref:Uncharacterized protein n=1 Tax=Dactylonectria macrodidyma TaxID=307937 RepID=A0A9P9J3M6_9HYPO|nr:hypothetical protein EDB81DRAFT_799007 [Dactylonectria macrodidyma]
MAPPSIEESSESGIVKPSSDRLELLVREHLDTVFKNATKAMRANKTPTTQNATMADYLGEYLVSAAQVWFQLTDEMLNSPEMEQVVLKVHENSKSETRLADLSAIVSLDVNITKLSHIRNLTEKFSRDIHEIWRSDPKNGSVSSG